jgi:uncharacterized membrane protein
MSVVNGFTDYPAFLGYNQVVSREDADVVLTINNDPLLVLVNTNRVKPPAS